MHSPQYIIISIVACIASALTLITGFGLATLLMPAFALFFPVETAVAATAVVHLVTNLSQLTLVGRFADKSMVLRFALPAAAAAIAGGLVLKYLAVQHPLTTYHIMGIAGSITAVKLVVGALILGFSLFELLPFFDAWSINKRYASLGGILSGFFGGLSGHQGAFRSMVLLHSGLSKEEYVGTSAVASVLVDAARLPVYATGVLSGTSLFHGAGGIIVAACAAAIAGAFLGKLTLKTVKFMTIKKIAGLLLLLIGSTILAGLI